MKVITLHCLFFILTFLGTLESQDSKNQYFSFGVGPFGLLDPITPSLNLIAEAQLTSGINLEMTYGLDLIEESWLSHHPAPEFKHHEYKLGIRKVLKTDNKVYDVLQFWGLEYFRLTNNYNKNNGIFSRDNQDLRYSVAEISRKVSGLRVKSGWKIFSGRFETEFYFGGGLRLLNIQYLAEDIEPHALNLIQEISPRIDFSEGAKLKLDLNVGFKVSYCLKSNLAKNKST